MATIAGKLRVILRLGPYRRLAATVAVAYLMLYLAALQDISPGGTGFEFLTTDWNRMFDRRGTHTFEPIAQLTLPGMTILVSPVNLLIGSLLSVMVGLNLAVTYVALRQPDACSFNRTAGILAGVPALLAGSACCAPAVALILGLQISSLLIGVVQVLVPVSAGLLLLTLVLILRRTRTELMAADEARVVWRSRRRPAAAARSSSHRD